MRIYLLALFQLLSAILYAQNVLRIQDDPYFECLKLHIKSLKKLKVLTDTLYIHQKEFLKDYSGFSDNTFILMVDGKFIKEHTKKGKSLWVISINPLVFDEEFSSITIIDFGVSRKKNHYKMINNGGTKVKVEFDCIDNKYKYGVINEH